MAWQYHPVLLVFFAGVFIAIGVAAFSLRYLRRHGSSYLVGAVGLLGLTDAVWSLAAALKTANTELGLKLLFYKFEFLGSWAAPSLSIVIALAFVGWDRGLDRRIIAGLAAIPIVGIVLTLANPGGAMIVDPVLVEVGGVVALEHDFPPAFVAFLAWSLGLAALAAGLIAYGGISGRVPPRPALIATVVFLLPVAVVGLKVGGVYPPGGRGINVTPAANAVALGALGIAIGHYRIFELFPVGRHRAVAVMDTGYLLVGPDDTVLDANEAAVDYLAVDGPVGRPVRSVLPAADRLDNGRPGEAIDVELGPRTIELRSSPVRRQNQHAGMVILLRDVTARRRRERELAATNERLERFASVVSHDLRNPLEVADGRVRLALKGDPAEHLPHARDAHARMEALIEDLLTLARAGGAVAGTEPVNLSASARESWRLVATADAELVVETDTTIEADRSRFGQLLENLFRNAVEHAGDSVTVTTGPLPDGAGVYVADDGHGIPAADRDDVFEFGYSSTSNGTGIGLAIVDEIANAHGWAVDVVAAEAGGARFEIRTEP